MSDPSTPTRPRPPLTVEEVAKIRDDYASPQADPQVEELCDAYEALRQSLVALRTELDQAQQAYFILQENYGRKVDDWQRAEAQRTEAEQARDDYKARKDAAYNERNQMVAALSKLWPSHLCKHPESDEAWERDWMTIVCIHSPMGQMTWHLHDSQVSAFAHLTLTDENHWDGHDTPEKYRRLARLTPQGTPQDQEPT